MTKMKIYQVKMGLFELDGTFYTDEFVVVVPSKADAYELAKRTFGGTVVDMKFVARVDAMKIEM